MKQRPKRFQARRKNTPPQHINFKKNYQDYQCIVLTLMGFSRKFVSQETGLTQTQCDTRCQMLGVKRKLYRDGLIDTAVTGIDTMLSNVERQINKLYHVRYTGGK